MLLECSRGYRKHEDSLGMYCALLEDGVGFMSL
jgi:hypothetical protein